ncbi:hypothetical protein M501DRAFT_996604 [Patellaria atrata CBS 101060]|uniref:Uncharacterized protein n=1 Tax=Patellaria atrata CBS 101060 TaxID=1346257 RepID=A0A9P4S5K9_9PEZI|nr:hypothetical protein M501DRAFT_996604 [Patellaria atrata CBS 101060]
MAPRQPDPPSTPSRGTRSQGLQLRTGRILARNLMQLQNNVATPVTSGSVTDTSTSVNRKSPEEQQDPSYDSRYSNTDRHSRVKRIGTHRRGPVPVMPYAAARLAVNTYRGRFTSNLDKFPEEIQNEFFDYLLPSGEIITCSWALHEMCKPFVSGHLGWTLLRHYTGQLVIYSKDKKKTFAQNMVASRFFLNSAWTFIESMRILNSSNGFIPNLVDAMFRNNTFTFHISCKQTYTPIRNVVYLHAERFKRLKLIVEPHSEGECRLALEHLAGILEHRHCICKLTIEIRAAWEPRFIPTWRPRSKVVKPDDTLSVRKECFMCCEAPVDDVLRRPAPNTKRQQWLLEPLSRVRGVNRAIIEGADPTFSEHLKRVCESTGPFWKEKFFWERNKRRPAGHPEFMWDLGFDAHTTGVMRTRADALDTDPDAKVYDAELRKQGAQQTAVVGRRTTNHGAAGQAPNRRRRARRTLHHIATPRNTPVVVDLRRADLSSVNLTRPTGLPAARLLRGNATTSFIIPPHLMPAAPAVADIVIQANDGSGEE